MIQRLFYGLPALAERWDCKLDDLMHMGIKGEATICHDLMGVGDRRGYTSRNGSHRYLSYRFDILMAKPPEIYICTSDSLRMIANGLRFDFARYRGLETSGNIAYFIPPIKVEVESLCLLPAEVERLDLEVFGRAATASASAADTTMAPMPRAIRATRSNPLTVEIEAALARLPATSNQDAYAILAELSKVAETAGSCVIEVGNGFVMWRNLSGKNRKTNKKAIEKRLERLAEKGVPAAD